MKTVIIISLIISVILFPCIGYLIGDEIDERIQHQKIICEINFPSPSDCRQSKSEIQQKVSYAFDEKLEGKIHITQYCTITINWNDESFNNIPSVKRLCEVDGEIDRVTQNWISDTIIEKIKELQSNPNGGMK